MKRRQFFSTLAAASVGAAAGYGFSRQDSASGSPGASGWIDSIDGLNLEEIRNFYHSELFDRYLPNMNESVIDHEYGGFMCNVDIQTGELLSDAKRAWYEGRGMWAYAFLYNNIAPNPDILEVARKSKDFILQHQPQNGFWTSSFSREGEPISEGEGDIYGSLFIAEGLAEYAQASGEDEYFDRAKQIVLDCMERYDSPDYSYHISYLDRDAARIPGVRVLGHWMVLLIGGTHMLMHREDPEIRQIVDRSIDAIMNHHMNPDYRLLNEGLEHDLSRPENEFAQFAYMGHGIETLWMVMYEAIRRGDRDLFRESADAFRRHVEVATDAVYGGHFRALDHVDDYVWKVDKVLWLQEEVLIGSLLLIEHLNDEWAKERFASTLRYVRETYARPGYRFWTSGGDRTLEEHTTTRAEHYHHPRHLMLNLMALDRMIEREGRVSDFMS